jgi:hypothetical protein
MDILGKKMMPLKVFDGKNGICIVTLCMRLHY